MTGFVSKPIMVADLFAAIEGALRSNPDVRATAGD